LTTLNSFGEFDLSFPRKEWNRTHFPQIHADRIVRFVTEILGEIELGEFFALVEFLLEFELWLLEFQRRRSRNRQAGHRVPVRWQYRRAKDH